MGRGNVTPPLKANVVVTEIIDDDQKDVGPRLGGAGHRETPKH
jgi:hypothetical protein